MTEINSMNSVISLSTRALEGGRGAGGVRTANWWPT